MPPASPLLNKLLLLSLNILILATFLYLVFQDQNSPNTDALTFLTDTEAQSISFTNSKEKPTSGPQPLDPTPIPKPTPTPQPEPEKPVPETPEPYPNPTTDPTPMPNPDSEPEPYPNPTTDPTPRPNDEPRPESEPEQEPDPNPTTDPTPRPNGEPEPKPTPETPHEILEGKGPKISAQEREVDREGTNFYLTNGGVIPLSDPRNRLLCKLAQKKSCYSQYVAEHVDQLYSFSPVYAAFQDRFAMMYRHHTNFIGYMKTIGINSIVIEAIYPGQQYLVTKAGNEPWEIQVEIDDYIYYRENLLNVAIRKTQHLDYEYIMWIDAHQVFLNPYWWEEGIYQMARYPTVSFFHSVAHFENNNNRTFDRWKDLYGVQYLLQNAADLHAWINGKEGQWKGWQGNAVGVRKEIYKDMDYILDYCMIGCCDCSFNYATMNSYWNLFETFGNYGKQLLLWIDKTRKVLAKRNGVVRGRVYHLYHEHYYGSSGIFNRLRDNELDYQKELYRDENFTLHVREESILKSWLPPLQPDKIY